jgi:hypothetical protein
MSDYCFSCAALREDEQLGVCTICGCTQCGIGDCEGSCLCDYNDIPVIEPTIAKKVEVVVRKARRYIRPVVAAIMVSAAGHLMDITMSRLGVNLATSPTNNMVEGLVAGFLTSPFAALV